jgi:hypothetical protein
MCSRSLLPNVLLVLDCAGTRRGSTVAPEEKVELLGGRRRQSWQPGRWQVYTTVRSRGLVAQASEERFSQLKLGGEGTPGAGGGVCSKRAAGGSDSRGSRSRARQVLRSTDAEEADAWPDARAIAKFCGCES